MVHFLPFVSSFCKKSGIIRAFYVLVKDNIDKLGHLEGTKVLFCDLQHTTLASDRGAKHTICLSVIDQVHGYDMNNLSEFSGLSGLVTNVCNFLKAEDWKKFFIRYHETQLSQLIKETDYKGWEYFSIFSVVQSVPSSVP